ncbi:beta-galactosidase trimerization domain-containing protein [Rhodococcus pseudokoreensis]|uniref:Beta-galactosidase trimerization domain-containing protein n=1 Tax=Rhodococcus pseudokoreensis TaxID=2811421 RepID=A0A974W3U4_9NOCA|nr:beta-galactosidase trimerization domain-containing protein [Rhodococcus pseudokoreensis]QSE89808.1 beta-galactosidase trimerization domain-containing protein [Rhodococcus pseudokoreensis]
MTNIAEPELVSTSARRAQAAASTDTTGHNLWWKDPFQMFQTNIREIDASLDVERTLDQIQEYGANAWLISVGGIISNYPTQLHHQSPNPVLDQRQSGDLLGDALIAAHRRGVRVLARMDFSKVARPIAEANPEWSYIAPDGSRQVYNGLTSVCPSGAYYQEKLFEVIGEILDSYDVDGFFFNWMTYNEVDYAKRYRGVCQCLPCQSAFAPQLGGMLPTGPDSPGYTHWQRLSNDAMDRLLGRVREFIAARRPEAPLVMGDTADIVFHEANNAIGRSLWPHQTSEWVSVARSYRPDVPVLVNSVAFLDMPYRLVSEEPRMFEQYLLQAATRGAIPSTYIMGTQDDFDYDCLAAGSGVTRFHRDHPEVYTRLVPAASTAIVRPDPLKPGGSDPAHAESEFQGAWTALLERHIPFDALPEIRLAELGASGELDRYALLVLPDLGVLDSSTARELDAYVERGGALLIIGATGLDTDRSQLASSGVAERLVTMDTPETTWSSAVVRHDSVGAAASPLPILGAFHVVRAKAQATAEMSVLSRAPYGPPEKCYGHLPVDHPAWLEFAHGHGRTIALPWTPGRAYREVGLGGLGDVLADAARELLGGRLEVETDLPAQVEVVVGRSATGMVIHLRNLTGLRHQSFGDPVTIKAGHRLTLRNGEIQSVRALVAGADLHPESSSEGAAVTVALPEIGLFEVLTLT